jgi:hypothetical protein
MTAKEKLKARLRDTDAFLMLTNRSSGPEYSTNDGHSVNKRLAESMTGQFELPINCPELPELKPNDDGLFPGFSQTWRLA